MFYRYSLSTACLCQAVRGLGKPFLLDVMLSIVPSSDMIL